MEVRMARVDGPHALLAHQSRRMHIMQEIPAELRAWPGIRRRGPPPRPCPCAASFTGGVNLVVNGGSSKRVDFWSLPVRAGQPTNPSPRR
jgi:hypothetical protein